MINTYIRNFFQLAVENPSPNPTALYLYRDSTIVEKRHYKRFSSHTFSLDRPGQYSVAWFERLRDGSIKRGKSAPQHFAGFSDIPSGIDEPTNIALYGLNRRTIYAGLVLQKRHDSVGLIDPTGAAVGSEIFGIRVLSREEASMRDAKIVHYKNTVLPRGDDGTFSLEHGRALTLRMINLIEQRGSTAD